MRHIDEIIVHCTATRPNWWEGKSAEEKVREVRDWHVSGNGWSDIGYHFVIELDGAVKNGRPLHRSGAGVKGHNAHSIHVCYIGGMDKDKNAKDTRTDAQRKALDQVINELKMDYPTATIHGHNEFAAKACPSFDVQKEYGVPKPKAKATKAKAKSKSAE